MSTFDQKNQNVNRQVNAGNVGNINVDTNKVTCPDCQTDNDITNRFCKRCGQSLTKLCLTCWTENDLNTFYCVSCGVDLSKSRFGMPPQISQKWREKFVSLGWNSGNISEKTQNALLRMGQVFDTKREVLIFGMGVSGNSTIHKISVVGREILPDVVNKDLITGGLIVTSQRTIVWNYVDGWMASYPHEYLSDLTTNQGSTLLPGYKKAETFVFFLDYKTLGRIKIHKLMPVLYTRTFLERLTTSESLNARLDLQGTILNTVLVKRIQDTKDENTLFINFFDTLIELQGNFHKIMPDMPANLSIEQFCQDAPEFKLPQSTPTKEKDSCAPKAAMLLMIFIAATSILIKWIF